MRKHIQAGVLAVALTASAAPAATVVRLVAADRPNRPLVSDLVDCRECPYGGLIATDWTSAAKVGDQTLFPLRMVDKDIPVAADMRDMSALQPTETKADELLGELETDIGKGTPPRQVDRVDPIYKGKLFDGVKVGPKRARRSETALTLDADGVLLPGGARIAAGGQAVPVDCYPLAITARPAARQGGTVPFVPTLTWQGLDLLADMLFEYSPSMPLGDTAVLPRDGKGSVDDRLRLQRGTADGKRQFRQLTIYLPAGGATPYLLNGLPFELGADGVRVPDNAATNAQGQRLRVTPGNRYGVTLLMPEPPATPANDVIAVPLVRDLDAGYTSLDDRAAVTVSPKGGSAGANLKTPSGATVKLGIAIPPLTGEWRKAAVFLVARDHGLAGRM